MKKTIMDKIFSKKEDRRNVVDEFWNSVIEDKYLALSSKNENFYFVN